MSNMVPTGWRESVESLRQNMLSAFDRMMPERFRREGGGAQRRDELHVAAEHARAHQRRRKRRHVRTQPANDVRRIFPGQHQNAHRSFLDLRHRVRAAIIASPQAEGKDTTLKMA